MLQKGEVCYRIPFFVVGIRHQYFTGIVDRKVSCTWLAAGWRITFKLAGEKEELEPRKCPKWSDVPFR